MKLTESRRERVHPEEQECVELNDNNKWMWCFLLCLSDFLFVGPEEAFWQSMEGLWEQIVSDDHTELPTRLHAHQYL